MDIIDIQDQPLSSVIDVFFICQFCKVVDRNNERMDVGYICPNCGNKSPGGQSYFHIAVASLIDLMQEAYHQVPMANTNNNINEKKGKNTYKLSVVIFFCTLGEVLLEHFLNELMTALNIPNTDQERLLVDNLFLTQRIQKLFPSLTGNKWKNIIGELCKKTSLNYYDTEKFYINAINVRNKFLHRGNKWAIPVEMPQKCMKKIWALINLFVSLHNHYIPEIYQKYKNS